MIAPRTGANAGERNGRSARTNAPDGAAAAPLDDHICGRASGAWRCRAAGPFTGGMESDTLTLVLGGTGKTGRRVAERLRARGRPVRVGSRAGSPPFDWDDPGTWPAALSGAAAVYLTYQPDLACPARRSGSPTSPASPLAPGCGAWSCSPAAARRPRTPPSRACGSPAWRGPCCARPGSTRTSARAARRRGGRGRARAPGRRGGRAVRGRRGHRRRRRGRAHRGRARRAHLRAHRPPAAHLRRGRRGARPGDRAAGPLPAGLGGRVQAAAAAELPAAEARLLAELFTTTLDGRNAYLTDDVPHLLGRPGTDFAAYARRAAASGAWG